MQSQKSDISPRFFDAHMEAHPEEASTLGVRDHDERLCDPSLNAASGELARLRSFLTEANASRSLSGSDDDDLDAVLRVASFHVRRIEKDDDASNLELSVLPSNALQHAALHARTEDHFVALEKRARAVPAFLAKHTENLRRGVRDGRAPDRAVAQAFAERILPQTAESIATIAPIHDAARDCRDAYLAFARFVEDVVLPAARVDVRLGEAETTLRLRETMGVSRSIHELMTSAKESLANAHLRIEENAGKDARSVIAKMMAPLPPSVDEALTLYRQSLDAATNLVVDRNLMALPKPLALKLAPLPRGFADGGSVTNWPAPLLDQEGSGHVLYALDLAPHISIATKNLAVHEGIPGHYLQSATWQRMNVDRASAVRWIGVSDPCAMSRGYFGAMVSVEGWAVYVEQLLREEGFYDKREEELFFAVCDAIRASRVLLDLEYQAGDMTTDQLIAMVSEATFLPPSPSSILRSKRMPLQGLTYLVGSQEILDLRSRKPKSESLYDFHTRVLKSGPIPLSRLAERAR